ncbi:response regulator [Lysobacter auxotrophicus]|uniref:Response regulator n=1 Tax=Lysobacter auxotrophicus TaxID=2992573 RepID=A0ABN6UJN1_9GAMM|nr:response regulator [Lysobacter auxotrophicus]BDU16535.1 response regulator [Lysobacter auxotrophicus]
MQDPGESAKRSVLVVDPNRFLARTTAQALQAQGFAAEAAMTATSALRFITAKPFDAAIIDVDLNGRVSGVELLRAMRELRPGLSAVLTTGGDQDVEIPPNVVVMRKPCRIRELVATIFREDAA